MAPAWLGWLSGLVSGQPAAGTHEALLEEARLGALFDKEARKPPAQRDGDLVHKLRVDYRKHQLQNVQVKADTCARNAAFYEHGEPDECCAANGWVRRRLAASYRALHDFHCQHIQKIVKEIAAGEARLPSPFGVQPALHLDLPEPLQQQPPRLDMCSECAERLLQAELLEQSHAVWAETYRQRAQLRAMQAAPGSAGAAAAAAGVLMGEAQQAQHTQQAQQAQQAQQQQQCASDAGGSGDAPATLKQPPLL